VGVVCRLVSIGRSKPTAFQAVSFQPGATFGWEFMWRTFSNCWGETFSTPAFANGPGVEMSLDAARKSACATYFATHPVVV